MFSLSVNGASHRRAPESPFVLKLMDVFSAFFDCAPDKPIFKNLKNKKKKSQIQPSAKHSHPGLLKTPFLLLGHVTPGLYTDDNKSKTSSWSPADQNTSLECEIKNWQPSNLFFHWSLVWRTRIPNRHSTQQECKVDSIFLIHCLSKPAFNSIDFTSLLIAENIAAWLNWCPLSNFSRC